MVTKSSTWALVGISSVDAITSAQVTTPIVRMAVFSFDLPPSSSALFHADSVGVGWLHTRAPRTSPVGESAAAHVSFGWQATSTSRGNPDLQEGVENTDASPSAMYRVGVATRHRLTPKRHRPATV